MGKDYVRLIISDTHLGSAYSKEKELYDFLKSAEYDELILAGDIVEFLRKPEFTKSTFDIIRHVLDNNKKVVYIVGNHDDALDNFVGNKLSGVNFFKSYEFSYLCRKYRI